jgi:PAS domain S-box-containing protein
MVDEGVTKEQLLAELAELRALDAERVRAVEAEREERILVEALRDTAAALNSTLDPDDVLDAILVHVGRVVPCDTASIMLIEDDLAHQVRRRRFIQQGSPQTAMQAARISDTPLLRRMAESGEPLVVPDTRAEPDWLRMPGGEWIGAYAGAPIRIGSHVIGFLAVNSATPGAFNAVHAERLQAFANQVGTAIQNARLYETVRGYAAELEQRVIERTAELRRTKDQVEAILNHSSDAIVVMLPDGTIQQANPAFRQMFGYGDDEVFGRPLPHLIAPEHLDSFKEALRTLVEENRPLRIEVVARRQDGTVFDADMALSLIPADHRRGVVCSLRDITQRKRMKEELRKALLRERELGELKSRFVSMVSHEFRTPLAIIQSSSDLLKRYSDRMTDEQKIERLDQIQAQVRSLTNLLEDILTISRAETVGLEFKPEPLNLELLCRDVVDEVRVTARKTHQVVFSCSGNCDGVILDKKLLRQAIVNLLSNAVKYSPNGGTVRFDVECEDGQVILRVTDEGIGIPEDDQQHLFETFHRAKNVGTIPGTGLGLAIVKEAVKLHRGTISFESQLNAGTTFTIRLPRSADVT